MKERLLIFPEREVARMNFRMDLHEAQGFGAVVRFSEMSITYEDSRTIYSYAQHLKDVHKFGGMKFDRLYIHNEDAISWAAVQYLMTRVRS
jgi:hypothetical protein